MHRFCRLAAAAVLLVAATDRVRAADPVLPAAAPAVVDVVVNDAKGAAVTTLKATDFTITEAGASIPVAGAALVKPGPRRFAIFLDEFHAPAGDAADRVRAAVRQFIDRSLTADDELVVFKPLDSILSIHLTTDRAEALGAVDSFIARRGDYTPRTPFEQNYIAGTPERVEAARTQIAISAMNALSTHLGSLGDGRKTLIVVSDGLGRRAHNRAEQVLPSLDTVKRAAGRAQVAVYTIELTPPVDDSADGSSPDAAGRAALRSLAADTGGRSAVPGDDVNALLARAGADASSYYALTLGPASAERDGRFHAVNVHVSKPGARIRARAGYWAESLEEARVRAFENAPPPKRTVEPPRRASPLIRPWFGMVRGSSGETKVIFIWEPAPPALDRAPARRPARIALRVARPDGTPVFDGIVRPSGAPAADGEPTRAEFTQPPGRLRVQMTIEDAAERTLDTDVRDLVLGEFAGPIAFGTAEVLRARTAREFRALTSAADAAPTSARQFSTAERLLIRVPVYTAGPPPQFSARLVSRYGVVMRQLTATAPQSGEWYDVDVPLAGLAVGDYTVQFGAKNSDGEVKDTLAIRVTY